MFGTAEPKQIAVRVGMKARPTFLLFASEFGGDSF